MTPPWKRILSRNLRKYLRRNGKCLKDMTIGTWNVLSLSQPAAIKMLLEQLDRYKLDITVIQEMRWVGKGIIEKKNHIVFYSCQRRDHIFGTGFIINKRIKTLLLTFKQNHA
jgi:exonuclease III